MKITRMNVTESIIPALRKALAQGMAQGLDMTFDLGRVTYDTTKGTVSLRLTLFGEGEMQGDRGAQNQGDSDSPNQGGGRQELYRRDWGALARSFDLDPDWLDKTFLMRGRSFRDRSFTIVGLNAKAHKNIVVAKNVVSGKLFVFPPMVVKLAMSPIAR